ACDTSHARKFSTGGTRAVRRVSWPLQKLAGRRRWSLRNTKAVDEAREHFKRGGGEKKFYALEFGERPGERREEVIVHTIRAPVQKIGQAESDLLFFRIRTGLEIRDAIDLCIRCAFLAR